MKELSVEQKAKAYDEALERAKGVIEQNPLMEYLKKGIEYIFPELKEGDKIRKSLLDYLYTLHNHFSHNGGLVTDWIAWLEKQGEQKPAENKGMNIVEEEMTPFQKKVFCIIDTTIEEEQGLKQVCDELFALASNEIKQKPAWSKEDEKMYTATILALAGFMCNEDKIDWLKSLKDRVQPKQEWSEEDEHWFKNCLYAIKETFKGADNPHRVGTIDLLKSLKDRYTWKPSEEQLKTFEYYLDADISNKDREVLFGLYKQLKQL